MASVRTWFRALALAAPCPLAVSAGLFFFMGWHPVHRHHRAPVREPIEQGRARQAHTTCVHLEIAAGASESRGFRPHRARRREAGKIARDEVDFEPCSESPASRASGQTCPRRPHTQIGPHSHPPAPASAQRPAGRGTSPKCGAQALCL